MSILERFNLHLYLASPPSIDLPTEWPNLETFKNALVEVGKTTGLWEKTEWEAFSSSESEVYVRGVLDVDERPLFAYLEDEGRIVKLETLLHRALPSGVSDFILYKLCGQFMPLSFRVDAKELLVAFAEYDFHLFAEDYAALLPLFVKQARRAEARLRTQLEMPAERRSILVNQPDFFDTPL